MTMNAAGEDDDDDDDDDDDPEGAHIDIVLNDEAHGQHDEDSAVSSVANVSLCSSAAAEGSERPHDDNNNNKLEESMCVCQRNRTVRMIRIAMLILIAAAFAIGVSVELLLYDDEHTSNGPALLLFVIISGVIFFSTCIIVVVYDVILHTRRRTKSMDSLNQTRQAITAAADNNDEEGASFCDESGPMVSLYENCTVSFIDICEFKAWSLEHKPNEAFELLESIHQAFDKAAKKLDICYKVVDARREGGGASSYVAVAGLPKPRRHHAVVMVKFTQICIEKMAHIIHQLGTSYGPTTATLRARATLHSGPVTASVQLRAENVHFQLMGETVDTASQMEASGGEPSRILVSKATADLLIAAGEGNWLKPRLVDGKEDMSTYWVSPLRKSGGPERYSIKSDSCVSNESDNVSECYHVYDEEVAREASASFIVDDQNQLETNFKLVDLNVDILYPLLETIVSSRSRRQAASAASADFGAMEKKVNMAKKKSGIIVLDEMADVLNMPISLESTEPVDDELRSGSLLLADGKVKAQLRSFIIIISHLYRDVPFHNFEHARQVAMSTMKVIERLLNSESFKKETENDGSEMADVISADPLMHFAMVFSSLVYSVDHRGLTTAEVVKMQTPASIAYRFTSVNEQNSVDVSWAVLMDNAFIELRRCIYADESEMHRFRQLLVHAVLATDIHNKEMSAKRKNRWDKAFRDEEASAESSSCASLHGDQRATVVYEYMVQAAAFCHTMVDWDTYQEFSYRLFEERYVAWLAGRAGACDPSKGWYGSELGCFDFCILPLLKRLHKCGSVGDSYKDYLHHALANRKQWEQTGYSLVDDFFTKAQQKHG